MEFSEVTRPMKTDNKLISKKKFLGLLGVGLFSSALGWFYFKKRKGNDYQKVKLLTADGRLVEVDKSKLSQKKGKPPVSNKEIKKWMDASK